MAQMQRGSNLGLQLCKETHSASGFTLQKEGNSAKQLTISQLANAQKDFDNAWHN